MAIAPVPGERDHAFADRFSQLFGLAGDAHTGRSYAVDLGGVHLAMVDDALAADDVAAWLDGDLAAAEQAQAKHVIVVLHHAPYSSGGSRGSAATQKAQTALVPVLLRHRVDAVLSGHDHIYEHLLVDGRHYFVTGGAGPTMDGLGARLPTSVAASTDPHYLVIDVGATGVTVTAKNENATADVIDAVALAN